MVERPFADRRPVGPLMDINLDRERGNKVQVGVSGSSLPNVRKSPLNILYVLDKHVATLPKDLRDGTLPEKIKSKFNGEPRVSAKRSGASSIAPFDDQAIIVALKGKSLPVQQTSINRASNSIEMHYNDFGAGVKNIIIDTE